jgi:hypothetical protein
MTLACSHMPAGGFVVPHRLSDPPLLLLLLLLLHCLSAFLSCIVHGDGGDVGTVSCHVVQVLRVAQPHGWDPHTLSCLPISLLDKPLAATSGPLPLAVPGPPTSQVGGSPPRWRLGVQQGICVLIS